MQIVRAFIAQAASAAITVALAWAMPELLHGAWRLALAQGAGAALLSRLLRQPPWWVPMHLLFLPAALGLLTLQLPSWAYLLAVLLLGLVFWGTVKGDVPLFLSSSAVAAAVAAIAQRAGAQTFADLGSGIGSVVAPLARRLPQLEVEAWERAPLPWAITVWRCRQQPNVAVYRQSFWECDLSHYDVVFAFLSPAPMPALGEKIRREMRPGTLFVSSSFPVPEWEPESIERIEDALGTTLFCYRIAST